MCVSQCIPGDGVPGLEPLPARCQRTYAGRCTVETTSVSFMENRVGSSALYVWSCCHGVQMVASSSGRVLQLDDTQGQAVDEQHNIRPAGVPVLGDGELVTPVVNGSAVSPPNSSRVNARPRNSLPMNPAWSHKAATA